MLPSPNPVPKIDGQLIIITAKDLYYWVQEKLASLQNAEYDMAELGIVLVETLDREYFVEPDGGTHTLRSSFADYMARKFSVDESEYQYLLGVFDEFYGIMANRVKALQLQHIGGTSHLGISFFVWSGGDLVVRHHPVPY